MNSKNKLRYLYWIARVWSLVALFFLLFLLTAHIVEAIKESKPFFGAMSNDELFSFLFFPLGVLVSLIIVQFKHRLGGYLCLLSTMIFLISRPELLANPIIYSFGAPGLLFLIYSYLKPKPEAI